MCGRNRWNCCNSVVPIVAICAIVQFFGPNCCPGDTKLKLVVCKINFQATNTMFINIKFKSFNIKMLNRRRCICVVTIVAQAEASGCKINFQAINTTVIKGGHHITPPLSVTPFLPKFLSE